MKLAIVGGGPAGLFAAEIAARDGAKVTVFDAKASVGRKFLVAGRGGLNLTHAEPAPSFAARYRGADVTTERWLDLLADCNADSIRAWAHSLGIETFTASTGRVYPQEMKAAPLLRRWVRRLRTLGVDFALHHRWAGFLPAGGAHFQLCFETATAGTRRFEADAAILALGGGSWPETGSDGNWCNLLESYGVQVRPLTPANCGWEVVWPSDVLATAEGKPLKNVSIGAGGETALGELMVTRYGLEGGAIYQLGPALRGMEKPEIIIDFKPDTTKQQLVSRMAHTRLRPLVEARKRWNLGDAAIAILEHHPAARDFANTETLARAVKSCPVRLQRSRPLAEAISSAGGVCWSELDDRLMIRRLPGLFVAGEMIDWEAPTGGYLLQGCFATATRPARGALAWNAKRAA